MKCIISNEASKQTNMSVNSSAFTNTYAPNNPKEKQRALLSLSLSSMRNIRQLYPYPILPVKTKKQNSTLASHHHTIIQSCPQLKKKAKSKINIPPSFPFRSTSHPH
jgi:hypothetical protein